MISFLEPDCAENGFHFARAIRRTSDGTERSFESASNVRPPRDRTAADGALTNGKGTRQTRMASTPGTCVASVEAAAISLALLHTRPCASKFIYPYMPREIAFLCHILGVGKFAMTPFQRGNFELVRPEVSLQHRRFFPTRWIILARNLRMKCKIWKETLKNTFSKLLHFCFFAAFYGKRFGCVGGCFIFSCLLHVCFILLHLYICLLSLRSFLVVEVVASCLLHVCSFLSHFCFCVLPVCFMFAPERRRTRSPQIFP